MAQDTITVDVLVIGTGASGMATAITAASKGLEALVVEKEPVYGGTTARLGGGWLWIPDTGERETRCCAGMRRVAPYRTAFEALTHLSQTTFQRSSYWTLAQFATHHTVIVVGPNCVPEQSRSRGCRLQRQTSR